MTADPPRATPETEGDDERVVPIDKKKRERDFSQRAHDVVREATSRYEDDEDE